MGEFGTYNGERIKFGTCEDMLYLRPDQIALVVPEHPWDFASQRFRFPFPDEDGTLPGYFSNADRAVGLWGINVPEGIQHGKVQFVAHVGFNVMLPCPLSPEGQASGLRIHATGFGGPVRIIQQRVWGGVWVTVCRCGACEVTYRLETLTDAQPVIDTCRAQALLCEHDDGHRAKWWRAIAERIEAGYSTAAPGQD